MDSGHVFEQPDNQVYQHVHFATPPNHQFKHCLVDLSRGGYDIETACKQLTGP